MRIQDKVVVVTGGGNGIGRALCERFADDGARAVVVADVNSADAAHVARRIGGTAVVCDVGYETQVRRLVRQVFEQHGQIDLFCSNAGITVKGGLEVSGDNWQRLWDVNVMSRLFAARAVIPRMLERGHGYILHTASAAGVLTEIGSAPYSVTKHADVALAEWLSVQYGREGIGVSCLCPLGVETDMLDLDDPVHQFLQLNSITPEQVAGAVVEGLDAERFLILPHPEVAEFGQLKTDDYDRWLRGMQRLRQKLVAKTRRSAA